MILSSKSGEIPNLEDSQSELEATLRMRGLQPGPRPLFGAPGSPFRRKL